VTQDPFTRYDAAYVLGALSSEDRQAFEEHLEGCDRCSRAVRELAGLPGLLSRVDPAEIGSAAASAPLPDSLLPDLLTAVRRDRRRRSRVTIGVAAAATLLAVAGGLVARDVLDGPDGGPTAGTTTGATSTPSPGAGPSQEPPLQQMSGVDSTSLDGWVALEAVPWGTRLTLRCRYPGGDAYGGAGGNGSAPTYRLVVRSTAGTERVAGWAAVPGGDLTVVGATALRPDQITAVEVRDAQGHPVLRLTG
jgi:hypothetical protein